jgi:proline iminopeptidase
MRKKSLLAVAAALIVMFSTSLSIQGTDTNGREPSGITLWPEVKPYGSGYLQVSELHEIFYQLGGNPGGKPVMVLHGGPGTGCYPALFRYFNPEKFHVILHDQRGAGKSKPYAELKENTTWNLVEDIEKLRKHLGLGKVILFGGSWGSTLALAYGETYPQNVSGMILRGVFAATSGEIDHFYHGGAATFFPAAYRKLSALVPHPGKKNYPGQLLAKLQDPDPGIRKKYALAWARYELKIAFLELPDQRLNQMSEHWNPYAFALLENYYMANRCFFKEDQLLKNAPKLKDIPIIMVNGRYDVICPPSTAYRLQQKLPNARLVIAEKSGHSESETAIRQELLKAVKTFE